MTSMTSRFPVAPAFLALALIAWQLDPCRAQSPQQMVATTPFGQAKLTDGAGNVSYRVGAVFAASGDSGQRVSMTFICQPGGAFSLYIVQTRVPQDQAQGPRIGIAVDGQAARPIEARREIGNGLSAYTIAGDAEALAATMRAGRSLLLTLDDGGYSLPLEGLDAALTELAGVCPHG